MLSALQIASQGFTPLVVRLAAAQGFGDAGAASVAGGYGSSGTGAARRRYVVRRGNVLMSFARKEDADEAARQVAAELAPTTKQTGRANKDRFAGRRPVDAVQSVIEAPGQQLPDSLDLSAAQALAAEQGMAAAFRAAMAQHQHAQLIALYHAALAAQDEADIELLLLSMH